MPNNNGSMAPRGGTTRKGFDQLPVGPTSANLSAPGSFNQNVGQDPVDPGPIDPETCAHMIQMFLNGMSAQDQQNNGETDNHKQLMQLIAQILQAEHGGNGDNGNGPPPGQVKGYTTTDRGMRAGNRGAGRGGRDQAQPKPPTPAGLPRPGRSNTALAGALPAIADQQWTAPSGLSTPNRSLQDFPTPARSMSGDSRHPPCLTQPNYVGVMISSVTS